MGKLMRSQVQRYNGLHVSRRATEDRRGIFAAATFVFVAGAAGAGCAARDLADILALFCRNGRRRRLGLFCNSERIGFEELSEVIVVLASQRFIAEGCDLAAVGCAEGLITGDVANLALGLDSTQFIQGTMECALGGGACSVD